MPLCDADAVRRNRAAVSGRYRSGLIVNALARTPFFRVLPGDSRINAVNQCKSNDSSVPLLARRMPIGIERIELAVLAVPTLLTG